MDILNWVYLLKNKLIKTEVINPDQDLVILGSNVTFAKRGDKYQSYGMTVTDFGNDLLSGTDYIIVQAKGTPEENAQEFIEAYTKANAADRDAEHRFTLVLAPGHYKFQETFNHDRPFIDIVSLTGEQDVIFDLELNGEDPFANAAPAYFYNLSIEEDTIYIDTLQSGQPSFLSVDETVVQPMFYGFSSTGMYFGGAASNYPVYTNFVISQTQETTVTFTFIHENCSDQGVCVYLDGTTPEWDWNPNPTRIAAQYDCDVPKIYGTSIDATGTFSLVIGTTYIAEFRYDPGAGTTTLVTKDTGGTILDTIVINQVLGDGNYRIAFSADSEQAGDLIKTSPVMTINTSNTKVSGIKTEEYTSSNYVNWASGFYGNIESDYYPLPLDVTVDIYNNLEVKNCTAGPFSFGSNTTLNNFNISSNLEATFIDCTALGYSFGFGAFQIEAGTVFTNCSGGNNSFYIEDDLRGTYTNCTAGNNSFYSLDDDIEGTFVNCTAGDFSFYTEGDDFTNDASFTNCTAGTDSFYANDFISDSVIFTNCTAGNNSFRADGDTNEATYTNCIAGNDSFWSLLGNYGTYHNCIGQSGSFYDDDGVYFMNNYYCLLYTTNFSGGNQYYCQDAL